uniref:Mannosyl-glycoprotein endo-beta-N-acetylglucosaminidase n=1 Tax=Plectus sambesii TaxID=2011161 RepID=A0A914VZH8_9BILA
MDKCGDATTPLDTLEELLQWDHTTVPSVLCGKPLVSWVPKKNDSPQTLVCHDMKGGYLQHDRFVDGCAVEEATPFYVAHWWYMDVFVYFSHHLVTLPPVGWINAAHQHGVLVLGTFITEWEAGAKICSEILSDPEKTRACISQLTLIAKVHNFDGWLINIENVIEYDHLTALQGFLSELTKSMRSALGERSRVVWYDSVIATSGRLKWQDELNALNRPWFDCCDAIFLNYTWTEASLRQTAAEAADRKGSVFVGVDCFGRGTFGDGGWNCCEAFGVCRKLDLSVALFAPGWVCETLPTNELLSDNIQRFWAKLCPFVECRPLTVMPFSTNFSIGFTAEAECGSLRFNLSDQQIQPHSLSGEESRIALRFAADGSSAGVRISSGGKPVRIFRTSIEVDKDIDIVIETWEPVDFQLVVWLGDTDAPDESIISGQSVVPLIRSFRLSSKELLTSSHLVGIGLVAVDEVNVNKLTASYCC